MPWMAYDLSEQFHFPTPFVDPDGDLRLSTKQARTFVFACSCVRVFADRNCRAGEPHAGVASPRPILDEAARDDTIRVGLRHRASARPHPHTPTPPLNASALPGLHRRLQFRVVLVRDGRVRAPI